MLRRLLVPFITMCFFAASLVASSSSQPAPDLAKPFVGEWTGILEYRDFSSDATVRLPTWLTVTQLAGKTLRFAYTYDDGPNKTVVEQSTIKLDPAANIYTVTADRDHSSDTYIVDGFEALLAKGTGVLTLTGTGQENNKPVDVRITLTIGRNIYMFRKETRLAGQDFKFRDGYTFTRRQPPALSALAPTPP